MAKLWIGIIIIIFVFVVILWLATEIGEKERVTEIIWPDVFVESDYEYSADKIKERAVADGLQGWGLCMAGNTPPKTFGQGMAKISIIIGESAIPENLHRLAGEILEN